MGDKYHQGSEEQFGRSDGENAKELDKFLSSLNLSKKEKVQRPYQEVPAPSSSAQPESLDLALENAYRKSEQEAYARLREERQSAQALNDVIVEGVKGLKKDFQREDELKGLFRLQEEQGPDHEPFTFDHSIDMQEYVKRNYGSLGDETEDLDIDGIMSSVDDISSETGNVDLDSVESEVGMEPENGDRGNPDTGNNVTNGAPRAAESERDRVSKEMDVDMRYDEMRQEQTEEREHNHSEAPLREYEAQSAASTSHPREEQRANRKESLIDRALEEDIEKLKRSGYKPQGFVFEEGVNSKTVPEVPDAMIVTEDGNIDYDKIVGENRIVNIESIYDKSRLIKQMSETVFMIELYNKTLPANLPIDVKRESVLNIVKASSIQIEELLADAYQRIDVLNEVLEDIALKSDELDKENRDEIEALEEKIQELKTRIQKRASYKQSQNAMIGYEIQRIVNIVEFINPE